MNLVNYIIENRGVQRSDEIHDSFVRLLSSEEILKSLGINPPYHAMGFEVKASNGGRRGCDLIVLNHELSIIEAKVIRSLDHKKRTKRVRNINNQLKADYSFFNRKKIGPHIRLIGVYKMIDENFFNFYILPSSGLNIGSLKISQISCL